MDALTAYITDAHTKRFQWGTFDCFLFAAGAVAIETGVDHMAELRGYRDETTAEVLLRERFGTTNLRDVFLTVAGNVGAKQVEIENAQNGDIACVRFPAYFLRSDKIDQSCGLGVWYENKVFILTPTGVMQVPGGSDRIMDVWSFR